MIKEAFRIQNRKYYFVLAVLLLLMLFCFVHTPINTLFTKILNNQNIRLKNNEMLIHIVSVGEADALAINFPNGEVAIIDTGTIYSSTKLINYINENVINNKRNKTIDYLFYTHSDDDHTGGLIALMNSFDINKVVRSRQYARFETIEDLYGQVVTTPNYNNVVKTVYEKLGKENLITATDNMRINFGEAYIQIYYPLASYKSPNDYSYFIKVCYNNKSILISGDATEIAEKEVLSIHKDDLHADIFKVGHHGSSSSNTKEFITAISPEIAVISTGDNNLGHPSSEVLERLSSISCQVYRTDQLGNILISISDDITVMSGHYFMSRFESAIFVIESVFFITLIVIFILDIFKIIKNNSSKIKIIDEYII